MKVTYHIPTEQFGFTEVECDGVSIPSYDEAKSLYGAVSSSTEGLDVKTFNSAVEEYLTTETVKGGTNLYEQMNKEQQTWFQTTKRALKRIKAKQE